MLRATWSRLPSTLTLSSSETAPTFPKTLKAAMTELGTERPQGSSQRISRESMTWCGDVGHGAR